MNPETPDPDFKERRKWRERPRWTARKPGGEDNGKAFTAAWSREGKLRFIEIVNHLINERNSDKEKGDKSVESVYMKRMKEKLDKKRPNRKRVRESRDSNDVAMPIFDYSGKNIRAAAV